MFACLYPGLCDVARSHGYALAIHGTLTCDLDLIAVPWTVEATDATTLKNVLMAHIVACGYDDLLRRECPHLTEDQITQLCERSEETKAATKKPHGRMAWNLYLHAGVKIDLSVMPRIGSGFRSDKRKRNPRIM